MRRTTRLVMPWLLLATPVLAGELPQAVPSNCPGLVHVGPAARSTFSQTAQQALQNLDARPDLGGITTSKHPIEVTSEPPRSKDYYVLMQQYVGCRDRGSVPDMQGSDEVWTPSTPAEAAKQPDKPQAETRPASKVK